MSVAEGAHQARVCGGAEADHSLEDGGRFAPISTYAYSRLLRFITDCLIGGYVFTHLDSVYQSANFFLNLFLYMLTILNAKTAFEVDLKPSVAVPIKIVLGVV